VTCTYFADVWERSQRAVQPTLFSVYAGAPTSFPRFELWWSKLPRGRHPCKCGCSDDALKCWIVAQHDLLMGGRRSG